MRSCGEFIYIARLWCELPTDDDASSISAEHKKLIVYVGIIARETAIAKTVFDFCKSLACLCVFAAHLFVRLIFAIMRKYDDYCAIDIRSPTEFGSQKNELFRFNVGSALPSDSIIEFGLPLCRNG